MNWQTIQSRILFCDDFIDTAMPDPPLELHSITAKSRYVRKEESTSCRDRKWLTTGGSDALRLASNRSKSACSAIMRTSCSLASNSSHRALAVAIFKRISTLKNRPMVQLHVTTNPSIPRITVPLTK